jgi:hypothetical protein
MGDFPAGLLCRHSVSYPAANPQVTPYDFTQGYGLPQPEDRGRNRCTRCPCPICGGDLDFSETDDLGRVMESCLVCKTRRLLPRDPNPPAPAIKRPYNNGVKGPRKPRRRA